MTMQTVCERTYQKPVSFDGRTKKKGFAPHGIRWTVDEYYKIYEQGLFQGRRVELIKGRRVRLRGKIGFRSGRNYSPLAMPDSKIKVADMLPLRFR